MLAHRIYEKQSKVSAVSYICFAKNLSNLLVLLTQWYRESSSTSGSVTSTPKYYQRPGMDLYGDLEAFSFFFDDLIPCVTGQKVWTLSEKGMDFT
jgi:hypothetical protein